jgi:polar amino acid transport system substrate-binding protein
MKRISIFLFALSLTASILTGCAEKGPPIKVRIGTSATYPPFESVDLANKEMIGFDIDLMKAIAEKANLEVEFSNTEYNSMLRDIAQCNLDGGIAAIPITDDLKKEMSFSNGYISIGQVVVIKQNNSTITGLDKLGGMTVGVQIGSPGEIEVQKITGAKIKTYRDYDFAFQELTLGLIDAVVIDKPFALTYVNIVPNGLKIAGKEFAVQDFGIAVCSQQPDLLKKINSAIRSLKFNGTVEKLTEKWITNPTQ